MTNEQPTPLVRSAGSRVGGATGFEIAAADRQGTANIQSALARNRAFAAAVGHEGAVVFPTLRLYVITCLDPRTDPAHFLGLDLSDAIVARNVGGRVTPEIINDVAFIAQIAENVLPDGPLFEVAVIHHTQCGTGALADDAFRHDYAQRIGADESTLREHAVLDPPATVSRDVDRIHSAPAISPRVTVSGHVTTSSPAWWRPSSPAIKSASDSRIEPTNDRPPDHPGHTASRALLRITSGALIALPATARTRRRRSARRGPPTPPARRARQSAAP